MRPITTFTKVRMIADPELKTFKVGAEEKCCVDFAAVYNESYKKRGASEYTDIPHFFNFKVYEGKAKFLARHGAKGKLLNIVASPKQESWEKDGKKNSRVVFSVIDLEFSEKLEKGSGNTPSNSGGHAPADPDFAGPDFCDDDMPF